MRFRGDPASAVVLERLAAIEAQLAVIADRLPDPAVAAPAPVTPPPAAPVAPAPSRLPARPAPAALPTGVHYTAVLSFDGETRYAEFLGLRGSVVHVGPGEDLEAAMHAALEDHLSARLANGDVPPRPAVELAPGEVVYRAIPVSAELEAGLRERWRQAAAAIAPR